MYFQDIILTLQKFWSEQGCAILQPYDMEVGAGTSHPATSLRCLTKKKWNVAYVQPCKRPLDGRYGDNPNRMQHYYQFQVIMKPSPDDIQEICLKSLSNLGIDLNMHDIRFIKDDWKNPTLGACGLGWEIWCDGMEIIQYTYMQQLGGVTCSPVPCEITYGLERLAMYIQNISNVWELQWNSQGIMYKDIFLESEKQYCKYNFDYANTDMLAKHFVDYLSCVEYLIENAAVQPAYDYCLKASHIFNVLESRGVMSVTERELYMKQVRDAVKMCCDAWIQLVKE